MHKIVKRLISFSITGFTFLILDGCVYLPNNNKLKISHSECLNSDGNNIMFYPTCTDASESGEICSLAFEDLRPTQFTYGDAYVLDMKKRFAGKISKAQKFFCSKPPSIVIGPKSAKGFFLTDGHHRMKLVEKLTKFDSNIFTVVVKVDKNMLQSYPDMSSKDFWQEMSKNNDVYLKDKGVLKTPEELPLSIRSVTNDPYRSLAGFIAEDSSKFCFDPDLPTYGNFAEFYWGDYIRNLQGFDNYTDSEDYNIIKNKIQNYRIPGSSEIVNICLLPEAKNLPGYLK